MTKSIAFVNFLITSFVLFLLSFKKLNINLYTNRMSSNSFELIRSLINDTINNNKKKRKNTFWDYIDRIYIIIMVMTDCWGGRINSFLRTIILTFTF